MTAFPSGSPLFHADDPLNGNPLVGGLVYTYLAGTTTLTATWADAGQVGANPNPVVLDAAGNALIYISGTYKFVLRRSDGTLLYTIDGISAGNGSSVATGTFVVVIAAGTVTVAAGDGTIAINKAAPSATPIQLPAVVSRNGLALHIVDWSGNNGDVTITPFGAEKIMGLASAILGSGPQGIGSAASITLYPSTTLNGWHT